MALSKMPNEVLTCILNHRVLPLPKRLYLRALSKQWCDVIEEGLMKDQKNVLVIRDSLAYTLPPREPDHLIIKSTLSEELIHLLVRLFSSTSELTISLGTSLQSSALWSKVHLLLAQLATNLTTLNLYGVMDDIIPLSPLADVLNEMPSLSSLKMHFRDYFDTACLLPLLGPALSRLEKLSFTYDSLPEKCWLPENQSITSLSLSSSLSSRCTHLELFYHDLDWSDETLLLRLGSSLAHLTMYYCTGIIWQTLAQLHQLRSLTLFLLAPRLVSSMFRYLAPLSSLTDVKLLNLAYYRELAWPAEKTEALLNVKRLTLEIQFSDQIACPRHYLNLFEAIHVWFPHLSCFTLEFSKDEHSVLQASLKDISFSAEILVKSNFAVFLFPEK